jgi:two-component system NtrC family sensor kinase
MIALSELIAQNEDWLMARVCAFAVEHGYTRYISTLEEAWRISVRGLSFALLEAIGSPGGIPALGPDDDFRNDPLAAFGVAESRRHRERGIPLAMFLGLFKYYRKSFLDLVRAQGYEPQAERRYSGCIGRFFDRSEIAFCVEWSSVDETERVLELQKVNRGVVQEKTKYLAFFENYPHPVLLLDLCGATRDANLAARRLFDPGQAPGSVQYGSGGIDPRLGFMSRELAAFSSATEPVVSFRKSVPIDGTARHFDVRLSRMGGFAGSDPGIVAVFSDTTAEMDARGALRESEELFRLAADSLPDSLVIYDRALRVLFANAVGLKHCGKTLPEVVGRTNEELYPDEFTGPWLPALKRVAGTGLPERHECRIPLDGRSLAVDIGFVPLRDVSGHMNRILAIGHDITPYREAEAQFRDSENRFRTVFEDSPIGIALLSPTGKASAVNPAAREMLGYGPEDDLLPIIPSGISPPGELAEYAALFSELLSGKRSSYRIEKRFLRKDGTLLHGTLSVSIVRDPMGVPVQAIATLLDITDIVEARSVLIDEKRALESARQELLAKNQELNRLLTLVGSAKREWEATMDCIDDMVVLADHEGRIRRCNQPFHNFTGRPFDEIVGRRIEAIFPELGFLLPTLPGQAAEQYHEGSGRWFVLHKYAFEDRSAYRLSGIVVTLHDATELKQAAHAVELKNRELKDALAELRDTQAKVLQREKMASIGQLAAGVAHEINNPIGFVASNLAMLRKYAGRITEYLAAQGAAIESCATGIQKAELAACRKSLRIDAITGDLDNVIAESLEGTDRVRRIVLDLKTFSRVDEDEMKPADINGCIGSTLNIVWNELKYKTTLVKDLGELPQVRCHPQQINQVIMNLLVNAAHAIETQGTITIRSWAEPGWVAFSIGDTGCGIPAEDQRKIFEPFFTTKAIGVGTGLGLSITWDIVKKHRGEISIDSEVGRGTTFTVKIPHPETT